MAGFEGHFTAGQRLLVAARIAATSFFCNRPTILTAADSALREARDLCVEDLAGGREGDNGLILTSGNLRLKSTSNRAVQPARTRPSGICAPDLRRVLGSPLPGRPTYPACAASRFGHPDGKREAGGRPSCERR